MWIIAVVHGGDASWSVYAYFLFLFFFLVLFAALPASGRPFDQNVFISFIDSATARTAHAYIHDLPH